CSSDLVPDEEEVPVDLLEGGEVRVEGDGARAGGLQVDVVDVKGGGGAVGAFDVQGDVAIAQACVPVGRLQEDPAVVGGDHHARQVDVAGRAPLADLGGELEPGLGGLNEPHPDRDQVLLARLQVRLHAEGGAVPALGAALHLEGVPAAFGPVGFIGDRQPFHLAPTFHPAEGPILEGDGGELQVRRAL